MTSTTTASSTTADWPAVDANTVSLPQLVSSSDLFDGELFGDELIEMYSTSVGDATSHPGVEDNNDIPHLLVPAATDGKSDQDENHPGVQVATTAAAIDDGLGAFRPSTSFNDLTTLLSQSASEVPTPMEVTSTEEPVAAAPETKAPAKGLKKRKNSTADSPTTTKKKPATGRTRRNSKKQQQSAVAVADQIAAAMKEADAAASLQVSPTLVPVPSAEVAVPSTPTAKSESEETAKTKSIATVSPVSPTKVISVSKASANTEADFKSKAQAAVSDLMQTASNISKPDVQVSKESSNVKASAVNDPKLDTSTDHIKALTGNNWVSACPAASASVAAAAVSGDSKADKNNRDKRQSLTPDERARQNRDRNREHARNTRLRKKAYVEELKRTLMELVTQRDAAEFEKRQAAQREVEQREVRFRVIEEFLKLRARNERNFARWAAILEDGFNLTIPLTPYRSMVENDGEKAATDQSLKGVADVMADADFFATFLQTLGSKEETISYQYHCDRKNFFMDGACALLEWTATSVGAVKAGASQELSVKGVLRGKFSPASNKLLSASISFDTGLIASQIRVVAPPEIPVIPRISVSFCDEVATAAAQAAASQADALLDSLQMPHLQEVPVPTAVTVVSPSDASSACDDVKGEVSSDESVSNTSTDMEDTKTPSTLTTTGVSTRRTQRRATA